MVWIYVCLDEENWGCLGFRVGCSLDLFGNIEDFGVIGGNIILIWVVKVNIRFLLSIYFEILRKLVEMGGIVVLLVF